MSLTVRVLGGALALAACTPKASPPEVGADAGRAAVATIPDAAPAPVPRFAALGSSVCLLYPDRPAMCGQPSRGGDARSLLLELYPTGSGPVTETAKRRSCLLTRTGEAICDGVSAGRGVTSVSGAPYLLGEKDVLVAEARWKPEDDAFRTVLAASLPPVETIEQIVGTEFATCALTKSGEVSCWSEPSFGFRSEVEAPVSPRATPVPGQHDIAELALQPWLTLCTRSKKGAVMCTSGASGVTQLCMLRGARDVRCGEARVEGGNIGQPLIAGAGYDPRLVLQRPLVAVPGLDGEDGATAVRMWRGTAGMMMVESERRIFARGGDEGGCARLASGAVRCFDRAVCRPGLPWRSTVVLGLPSDVTRIELGVSHGYALTALGALYTWERGVTWERSTSPPCEKPSVPPEMRAVRVFEAGIVDVGGALTREWKSPSLLGIDCAIAANADVTCWATHAGEKSPIPVTRATSPQPKEF